MARKRITQAFPFLLPIRQRQRKLFFYLGMRLDRNIYSKTREDRPLPYEVFETSSPMVNGKSGYDIEYQFNKVYNLKLAARTIDHIVISPGETFSFYQLVRFADKHIPYKDGLTLINGKIVGTYGGGLCQLSNMLFWMFLHIPLTIVERHGHAVQAIPPAAESFPQGIDAAVNEGWLDLKVRNDTKARYQIVITFDDDCMYGKVLTDHDPFISYEMFNKEITYYEQNGGVFQTAPVWQRILDKKTNRIQERFLYSNTCQIGYRLPDNIYIEKKENKNNGKEKDCSFIRRLFRRI